MPAEEEALIQIEVERASFGGRSLRLLTIDLRRGQSRRLIPRLTEHEIAPGVYAAKDLPSGLQFKIEGDEIQIIYHPQC